MDKYPLSYNPVPDPHLYLLLLLVRLVVISRTFPVVWSNLVSNSVAVAYLYLLVPTVLP